MTDHSELKRLTDACPPPGTYHYQSKEWAALMEFQAAVEDVYGSDVGMAKDLIAEIERLREHKQSLVDLREAHGYESWASVLVMIDKLKAEIEALRKELASLKSPAIRTDKTTIGYTGCIVCGEYTSHGGLQCPNLAARSLSMENQRIVPVDPIRVSNPLESLISKGDKP